MTAAPDNGRRFERMGVTMVALLFLLSVGVVAARFSITADILAFMPAGEDRAVAALSREIAQSDLSRTVVVSLVGPGPEVLAEASVAFEEALRTPDNARLFATIDGGPPEESERAMWEAYHPRRLGFIAPTADAARARLSDAGLAEAASELRTRLESPMSALVSRVAPGDPLLALPRLFEQLEQTHGATIQLHEGRFVTADGTAAIVFLSSTESAFDADAQRAVLNAIDDAFSIAEGAVDAPIALEVSGLNRFAVAAEEGIRADIQRVSVWSALGLSLLLLVLFRSPRVVALAALPILVGVTVGSAATLLVFGRIHGVTLAFGASLIGVCIDYVIHLYCHHAAHAGQSPLTTMRAIWPALRTGALTTAVGFVALGASRFPGLREVALFAVTGIGAALAVTRFVLPTLMPQSPRAVGARDALAAGSLRVLRVLRSARRWVAGAGVLLIVFAVFGAREVRWSDGFDGTAGLAPDLVAEDARVRDRVAAFDQTRFVVAEGATDEDALQANERVARVLGEAVERGELRGYRSVAPLLPSAATQAAVAGAALDDETLWSRFEVVFTEAGYRPVAFGEFREALDGDAPAPVTFAELAASPLAPLVRPHRLETANGVAILTFLEDVTDADAVAGAVSEVEGAVFVDQSAILRSATQAYQRGTANALILGLAAVLIVLALRYRSARRTAAAFLPAVLAAGVTVATLATVGVKVDLVGLTALLMVVSMGVDYGVFLVDAHDASDDDLGAALVSVFVACVTTVFGFGTLALSSHPILHAIGLTAAVGVVSSFLLAPTALVLLAPRTE